MRITPIAALIAAFALAGTAVASDSNQLAGNTFVVYHLLPNGETHKCKLWFNRQGANMDLLGGLVIPASGTIKTKRQGRRGTTISDFSLKGEAPYGPQGPHGTGTIVFTCAKDGAGAKGSVTVTVPGKEPVTVLFTGTPPVKSS